MSLIFKVHAVLGVPELFEGVTDRFPRNVGGQLSFYIEKKRRKGEDLIHAAAEARYYVR